MLLDLQSLWQEVSARLSIAETPDAAVISGAVRVATVVSSNEGADSLSSAAQVNAALALSETEAADSIAAVAQVRIAAVFSGTEAADAVVSTAQARGAFTLSVIEGADSLVLNGISSIAAAFGKTEDADSLIAASVVSQPDVQAVVNITEQPDQLLAVAGSLAQPKPAQISVSAYGGGGLFRRGKSWLENLVIQGNVPVEQLQQIESVAPQVRIVSIVAKEAGDTCVAQASITGRSRRVRDEELLFRKAA